MRQRLEKIRAAINAKRGMARAVGLEPVLDELAALLDEIITALEVKRG